MDGEVITIKAEWCEDYAPNICRSVDTIWDVPCDILDADPGVQDDGLHSLGIRDRCAHGMVLGVCSVCSGDGVVTLLPAPYVAPPTCCPRKPPTPRKPKPSMENIVSCVREAKQEGLVVQAAPERSTKRKPADPEARQIVGEMPGDEDTNASFLDAYVNAIERQKLRTADIFSRVDSFCEGIQSFWACIIGCLT